MKKVHTISLTSAMLLIGTSLLCSCDKDVIVEEKSNNADLPWGGYIHFGLDGCEKTRGYAIEDLASDKVTNKDFGVITFQYSSDWNTFKATGKPSGNFPFPTQVLHSNGSWTYDKENKTTRLEHIPWDNSSKYAFFAYYPYDNTSNTSVKTETTKSTAGVPSITYTVPSWTDTSLLPDVMVSSVKDTKNNADGTVYFHFWHCLSCLSIQARNLDNAKDDHSTDQSITNLSLTITSTVYSSLTIPLDFTNNSSLLIHGGTKTGEKTYSVNTGTVTVEPIATTGDDMGKMKIADISGDNSIFIIPQKANDPQTGHLRGYVTFTDKSGTLKTGKAGASGYDKSLEFDSDKDFEPGRKYLLIVNFANGMISVAIVESGDWEEENIIHTFE